LVCSGNKGFVRMEKSTKVILEESSLELSQSVAVGKL
jgi:hypothetical protein